MLDTILQKESEQVLRESLKEEKEIQCQKAFNSVFSKEIIQDLVLEVV